MIWLELEKTGFNGTAQRLGPGEYPRARFFVNPHKQGALHAESQGDDTEQGERDQSAQDPRKALHPSVGARPLHALNDRAREG